MISLFFLCFLLLAALWNQYYARHWNKNLSVSLHFIQRFVYAGEQAEMTEQIENRKKLPLPVLEVAFHVDKRLSFHDCENTNVSDFTYKRDIFALLGNQRITRKLTLDCPKRGYYHIASSDLTTFSMLHRHRYSTVCPADTELYVYAARTNVSNILVICERLMGSMQCAKRLYEDPFAFSSIREYTSADPMNTINWKASARTGELMVNTFESTLTKQAMIYLDLEDSGILKYEYLTEESICVAASLVQKFISRGIETGIFINTEKKDEKENPMNRNEISAASTTQPSSTIYIKPSCSNKQLAQIEQVLAKFKYSDKIMPLAEILSKPLPFMPPEDAVIIFISKNVSLNQAAIERYVGREKQAAWVVPYTRNESCEIQTLSNIRVIQREVHMN